MIEISIILLFVLIACTVIPYIATRMTYGSYIPCMDTLTRIKGYKLNPFNSDIITCYSTEVSYIARVSPVFFELWRPYTYYISTRSGGYILIPKGSKEAEWIELKYNELNAKEENETRTN